MLDANGMVVYPCIDCKKVLTEQNRCPKCASKRSYERSKLLKAIKKEVNDRYASEIRRLGLE